MKSLSYALVAIALLGGCELDPEAIGDDSLDIIHLPHSPYLVCIPTRDEEPNYIDNSYAGDECTEVAKFNADVDAGYEPDESAFGTFVDGMAAAGFYTRGSGTQTSVASWNKLASLQTVLVGQEFEATVIGSTAAPINLSADLLDSLPQ